MSEFETRSIIFHGQISSSNDLALSKVSSSQLPHRKSFLTLNFGCGESPRRSQSVSLVLFYGKRLAPSTTVDGPSDNSRFQVVLY